MENLDNEFTRLTKALTNLYLGELAPHMPTILAACNGDADKATQVVREHARKTLRKAADLLVQHIVNLPADKEAYDVAQDVKAFHARTIMPLFAEGITDTLKAAGVQHIFS